MNKQRGSIDWFGLLQFAIVACVVVAVMMIIHLAIRADDPCTERNQAYRARLIETHERCMVEENCIYEDWDIRKYDRRLRQQKACKLED